MKTMTNKAEFFKVISFGEFDYDFSLNLSEQEAKKYNFEIEKAKSLKDLSQILQIEEIRSKVQMVSKNKLINLLLFLNKTNKHKTFIEFLSLNCIFLSDDLFFMKDRIKSGFDEDFMFLLESNILPPNKYKINVNVEKQTPKTFEMEFFMSDSKNSEKEKASEGKQGDTGKNKEENKKGAKSGNREIVNSVVLPNTDRPEFIDKEIRILPEGKDEKIPTIDPSLINKNQQSPLILSKKRPQSNQNQDNNSIMNNSLSSYSKVNLSEHLKYDFESCDYLLLDLNQYISNKNINLTNLQEFIQTKIIDNYLNTSIIMIFPNLDGIQRENYQILIELITMADIMIYDKRDAKKMCSLLGYKVEEKNFEVRFMFLKELKNAKYKPNRTAMFLEDFNKLTIIVQETETNLVVFHNEFAFNMGFKVDYYSTVTDNYETLKYVFLGGLLSRIIQNKSFDVAFEAGSKTFSTMLEALYSKTNYADNPDFFQVEIKRETQEESEIEQQQLSKSLNLATMKNRNKSSHSAEKNFVLDSVNLKNSKLPPYNPLKDSNLRNYFQSANAKQQQPLNSGRNSKNNNIRHHDQIEFIQQEQSKFLNILEQNQLLQKKLLMLLNKKENSAKPVGNNNTNYMINQNLQPINQDSTLGKGGLPKLDYTNPFNKLGNAPDYMRMSMEAKKKKNLKPITKEAYNRLTGASKTNNVYSMMNPQMMMLMMMQMNMNASQTSKSPEKNEEKKNDGGKSPEKTGEKKPEEKKAEKTEEKKNDGGKSPEKTGEKKPEEKTEKKAEKTEEKKKNGESSPKKEEAKNTTNPNSMFTPEFMNQYSEMMKLMGINPIVSTQNTQQIQTKKSNYKSRSYFDKKHGKTNNYEEINAFGNPTNQEAIYNPNQSIEISKSPSKSPSRKSGLKGKDNNNERKKEEKKFEGKGENLVVDDSKPLEQKKFEEEYKKKQEEKKIKDENIRKKKMEDEKKKKEENDKNKKKMEDMVKNYENEMKIKEDEEKIKKGKDFSKSDKSGDPKVDPKVDPKKTEEKKK